MDTSGSVEIFLKPTAMTFWLQAIRSIACSTKGQRVATPKSKLHDTWWFLGLMMKLISAWSSSDVYNPLPLCRLRLTACKFRSLSLKEKTPRLPYLQVLRSLWASFWDANSVFFLWGNFTGGLLKFRNPNLHTGNFKVNKFSSLFEKHKMEQLGQP